jgi:hypothetical protein
MVSAAVPQAQSEADQKFPSRRSQKFYTEKINENVFDDIEIFCSCT